MTSHADLSLVGSPGFNQPVGFRPLFVDDALPHQIRLFHVQGRLHVSCVCLKTELVKGDFGYFTSPAHWLRTEAVVEAIEALAWYRGHLTETISDDVSCGTVADMSEGGT